MLESKRLILQKPDLSFNAPLYDIHSDRQATQYTPKRRHTDITETNKMLKDWINHWHKYGFGYFVIVEKNSNKVIGSGGAEKMTFAHKTYFNLYYRLHPQFTGQGYATEAIQTVINWLTELDTTMPFVIRTDKNNVPSINLATRLGFYRDPNFDNFEGTNDLFFFNN